MTIVPHATAGRRLCATFIGLFLVASISQSQTAPGTARRREEKTAVHAPLKVRLWNEQGRMDAVIVGRTATHLLQAPDAGGVRPSLAIADLIGATFDLAQDQGAVMRAMQESDWEAVIRLKSPSLNPVFPYLDIPNNNAAEEALALGTIMMRAARRSSQAATDESGKQRALRQYEKANAVFQHCSRATWSSVGLLAQLKGCRCLIAMGRSRSAYLEMDRMEEPLVGDPAYGHYRLAQAELNLVTNGYALALDASVKSLCIENKDVETFPDALLISAVCYENLGEIYRARDVYFEVARLFPRTEWSEAAIPRLRAIQAGGKTREREAGTVERVFLGIDEDINQTIEDYLKTVANKEP